MPASTTTTMPSQARQARQARQAADTWASTNAWNINNDIAAQYRNESTPAGNNARISPITLEWAKTGKELRKIEDGKLRATAHIGNFDQIFFNDPPQAPKANKTPKAPTKSKTA